MDAFEIYKLVIKHLESEIDEIKTILIKLYLLIETYFILFIF